MKKPACNVKQTQPQIIEEFMWSVKRPVWFFGCNEPDLFASAAAYVPFGSVLELKLELEL